MTTASLWSALLLVLLALPNLLCQDFAECVYNHWSAWTACTATCNGGNQFRYRNPVHYAGFNITMQELIGMCNSELQNQTCGVGVCPIDCLVSSWLEWGACDCKENVEFRSRAVLQAAAGGGGHCPLLHQQKICEEPCSVDCQVSAWTLWSACSKTCNYGLQKRSRSIVGLLSEQLSGACTQNLAESRPCILSVCYDSPFCEGLPDGHYPQPGTLCNSAYVSCVGGFESSQECPNKLVFSLESQRCEYRDNVFTCKGSRLADNSFSLVLSASIVLTIFGCGLLH